MYVYFFKRNTIYKWVMKMKKNNKKQMQSIKNCKKTDVKSCNKIKDSKKITGFDDSKSFELDKNNDNSFEVE